MRPMSRVALFALLALAATSGCVLPRTKVVKNPGPDDEGVRYYRPKPYLLVQPAADSGGAFVTISMQQLPDYEEEYSIHVRTGLGANHTSITLTDGWNLTAIDQDLDSNFDENVKAIADLVSAAGGVAKGTAETTPGMVVRASNVPIGYYESIISRDSNGCKRLYGWRYVGFAPYEPCPVESNGVACHTCLDQPVYALTFRDGVMVFEPLAEVALRRAEECQLVPGPQPTAQGTGTDDVVKSTVENVLDASLFINVSPKMMRLKWNENHTGVEVTVGVPAADVDAFNAAYAAKKLSVDDKIKTTVGSGVTKVNITFVRLEPADEEVPTPAPAPAF